MVADSEGASGPFWSPDGAEIAYFTNDRLRAVNLATGRTRVICDVKGQRKGGTWYAGGVIVFATENGVPLKRVNAMADSLPSDLPQKGYRPFFLPNGRHFLFGSGENGGISGGDLESAEVKKIRAEAREPKYADGYRFFNSSDPDGLMAQAFNPESFKLSGEPIKIAEICCLNSYTGTNFSVAANGLIAFRRKIVEQRENALYSRDGTRTAVGEPGNWNNPLFSPDDSTIALGQQIDRGGDIWLYDALRGTGRLFASGKPTLLPAQACTHLKFSRAVFPDSCT